MNAIIGGVVIGVGLGWILAWLLFTWFTKAGLYSQSGDKPWESPSRLAEADARGRAWTAKAALVTRRGVPG